MNKTRRQHVSAPTGALLVAAIMASTAGLAYGQVLNGDFSTGGGSLTSWTPAGDVAAVPTLFGIAAPAPATTAAGLTTIGFNVPPFTTLSGTKAIMAPATIDSSLGLAAGTVAGTVQGGVSDASGLSQTFSANAGDTINFKWDFLTGEDNSGFGKDFAFYTLHQGTGSSSLSVLASDTSSLNGPSGTSGFQRTSGWTTKSITVPSSGTWTLGFGVADGAFNPGTDSALGIASVSITPVPEPWAWSLMSALALGGLAVARRVRFNRA